MTVPSAAMGASVDTVATDLVPSFDGNHTYEYAERDWQNVDEFLLPGGFVLFDDSAPHLEFEVYPVVRELKADPRYELVGANPNHLFRKIR